MKTGIVVGIGAGALLVCLGGGYAGISYTTGAKYIEEYEAKMQELRGKGLGPVSTIEQGVFASRIQTNLPIEGLNVGVIMTTDVDHRVTTNRWLSAVSTVVPDSQTAAMLKGFLQTTPQLDVTVTVDQSGSIAMSGQISPIVTTPNPLFKVDLLKPATFSYTTDSDMVPSSFDLSIPSLQLRQGDTKTEIQGVRIATSGKTEGENLSLRLQYGFKLVKLEGHGKKPVNVGPLDLKLDLSGLSKAALMSMQSTNAAQQMNPMAGLDLLSKSPGLKLVIQPSSLKTSFGDFEIKGEARAKKIAGSPVPGAKGEFTIKMPMNPRASAIYGPQIAGMLRSYLKAGMAKRVGNSLTTVASIDGDSILLNGKALGAAAALKMSTKPPAKALKKSVRAKAKALGAGGKSLQKKGKGFAKKSAKMKSKKIKKTKKKKLAH